MLEQIVSLMTLAALMLAAHGVGRPAFRGLGVAQHDPLTETVWSLAIGLVIWGSALAVLGLVGGLNRPLIVIATLAAALWGLAEAAHAGLVAHARGGSGESPGPHGPSDAEPSRVAAPPEWLRRGILILAMVAVAGSLIGAAAPPTAGDALCYHLELPKRFLDAGGFVYLPYHDNSTFPLLVEMWYLWALALDGGVAAQLVHWAVGILFALATVVLARPILGRRWAAVAGALAVLTPGVNNQMTAPMNDVALALFVTLWLAAWWRGAVAEEGSCWFVLAGLAAGGALATKYVALVFAVALAAACAWVFWHQSAKRRLLIRGTLVLAVVATSVAGVWYVRAAWHRGNPVYPFFAELHAAGELGTDALSTLPESKSPLGRGPVGLAAAPWQITMHPERFGGRGHQLGILFLAVLPALGVARRLRGLGVVLVVAAVYGLVWYVLRQNIRFLFPIVSLLSVAVVWVWIEMRRFPRKALVCAVAVQAAVLMVFALNSVDRSRHAWAVVFGIESREEYLDRREPTYNAAILANALLGSEAKILSQDCRLFYFDAPIVQEKVFRRACHYDQKLAAPEDLSCTLRAAGFTHLLLVEAAEGAGEDFNPTLVRLSRNDLSVEHIVQCTARDPDGGVRRYRLVELGSRLPETIAQRPGRRRE